jgi:hypothetical protein
VSALGDIIGHEPETPRGWVVKCCGYITDDSAVAAYVNHRFKTNIKPARVAEIRRTMSVPHQPDHKPLADDMAARRAAADYSNSLFLNALATGKGPEQAPQSLQRTRGTAQKLDEQKVREIRRLHASGLTPRQIAPQFNIAKDTVQRIVSTIPGRRTWAHVV